MCCDENLLSRVRLAVINCAKLVAWWTHKWSSRGVQLSKMAVLVGVDSVVFRRSASDTPDKSWCARVKFTSTLGAAEAPASC